MQIGSNQIKLYKYLNESNHLIKESILNDLKNINLFEINKIYNNSFLDEVFDKNLISPLKIIDKDSENNCAIGEEIVKNNQYAIVIMAGGMASRLGLNIPKGCLEINYKGVKKSLFQIYIDELKEINNKYNISLNLYIMTSVDNHIKIMDHFLLYNYFGYDKNNIKFFKQGVIPLLDIEGNILLKNEKNIYFVPNGNGDVFKSLDKNDLIDDMKNKNIKYVLFTTVDNVLTNLVDINFIGTMIKHKYKVASKTIFKEDTTIKSWVFNKYDGHPSMIMSEFIDDDINSRKENNNYCYRETNITYHLLHISEVKKFSKLDVRYHRTYKKNNYYSYDKNYVNPESNNTFKFEKYIFDFFKYSDDMLLYRTNYNEFQPIKIMDDIKKITKKINEED